MLQLPPVIAIVMGSDSDLDTMRPAAEVCKEFGVPYEMRVLSAHRTPFDMVEYGRDAHKRGIKVIIAGAGGAAHLPGMLAASTPLPVIGVPVKTKTLNGADSLLSIVQMPSGVPVATVAIGAGRNAGILAIQILGSANEELRNRIIKFKEELADSSREKNNQNPEFTKIFNFEE
ncbi:MAG: 5-(carboxyamino)imidazole ribonucleotide mutase [Candidatus Kapabacteria bacterium]|nr:5-(carboxyamino)imidazole ribonucleotide mutase [Candidatus Kapabacteria bacterium]